VWGWGRARPRPSKPSAARLLLSLRRLPWAAFLQGLDLSFSFDELLHGNPRTAASRRSIRRSLDQSRVLHKFWNGAFLLRHRPESFCVPGSITALSADCKNRMNCHPEQSEGSAVRLRAVVGVKGFCNNKIASHFSRNILVMCQVLVCKANPMTKSYLVIATAWLLHAASWFLPAIKGFLGSRLDRGIPGWEVFLSQTCALRPCGVANADPWYGTAISAAGVVTTLLFVLGSPWTAWRASRKLRHAAAFVATVAFVVNCLWYVFCVPDRSDLGVGYFLWCSSFGLLAIGLFLLAGSNNGVESIQHQQSALI